MSSMSCGRMRVPDASRQPHKETRQCHCCSGCSPRPLLMTGASSCDSASQMRARQQLLKLSFVVYRTSHFLYCRCCTICWFLLLKLCFYPLSVEAARVATDESHLWEGANDDENVVKFAMDGLCVDDANHRCWGKHHYGCGLWRVHDDGVKEPHAALLCCLRRERHDHRHSCGWGLLHDCYYYVNGPFCKNSICFYCLTRLGVYRVWIWLFVAEQKRFLHLALDNFWYWLRVISYICKSMLWFSI